MGYGYGYGIWGYGLSVRIMVRVMINSQKGEYRHLNAYIQMFIPAQFTRAQNNQK